MLEFIDSYIGRICHFALVGLCRITGRDNFFFAKVGLIMSYAALGVAVGLGLSVFMVLATAILICCLPRWLRDLQVVQDAIEQGADVVPQTLYTGPRAYLMRMNFFACSGMAFLYARLLGPAVVAAGVHLLFMMVHCHFVADFQPPSKSMARRAADWLRAHRPRLNLGGHNPYPVPG